MEGGEMTKDHSRWRMEESDVGVLMESRER